MAQIPNVPSLEHWTDSQVLTVVILERTGGCVSLVAVMLIFIAFWLVPEVRNVQNTFIVFASVSNVGASIASVIAMDGLLAGTTSGLCQAQSFMFEMFMQSDPWWALAMSVNVFLVFYYRTSPDSFQKWWWLYCLGCYGGPFVIALSLLLVSSDDRGRVYGEATIWCWVDREWDDIRIYTYYMLIWICIVGSIVLYFLVGYHVWDSRNQLRSFSTVSRSRETAQMEDGPKIKLSNVPEDGFYGTVITEVQVIHSAASPSTYPGEPKKAHMAANVSFTSDNSIEHTPPGTAATMTTTATATATATASAASSHFFSTVTSSPPGGQHQPRKHRHLRIPSTSQRGLNQEPSRLQKLRRGTISFLNKFWIDDPVKRAYLRTSFMFAFSVLVTWIPSSMNRIHSWRTGDSPFEYQVATAAVLPLQGLWNAVIFFVTSSRMLRKAIGEYWDSRMRSMDRSRSVVRMEEALGDGTTMGRGRGVSGDGVSDEDEDETGDVGTLGSDVELRRLAENPGKRSLSP